MPKIKLIAVLRSVFVNRHWKIRRNKAFTSHILTKKTTKRKRDLRQSVIVAKADERNIAQLIPYM